MPVVMIGASHTSGEYQSEGWLGTGGFATVETVRHRKSAKVYARKIIKLRPPLDLETCQQEITVMNRLSHHHIVPLISSEILPTRIELVLPLADGDLATYLESYQQHRNDHPPPDDDNCLKEWIGCLASGLDYLHGQSIRHKDIKPANILTIRSRVLYTDFGIARDFADSCFEVTSGTPSGTPLYYAPEVSQGQKRGKSADVFSLGCVYFEMLLCLSDRSFKAFLQDRFGCDQPRAYRANIENALEILDSLIMGENTDLSLYPAFVQCKRMIDRSPTLRPTAKSIHNTFCTRVRIGCNDCVDKGEEEKVVVVEVPRLGPNIANMRIWIVVIFCAWSFALCLMFCTVVLQQTQGDPTSSTPSMPGSRVREIEFATHHSESPFAPQMDATPSVNTARESPSSQFSVQKSQDEFSAQQTLSPLTDQHQQSSSLSKSWGRLFRMLVLKHFVGLTIATTCYRNFRSLEDNALSIILILLPVLLMWGLHEPGDFWELSPTFTSMVAHNFFSLCWLCSSCYNLQLGFREFVLKEKNISGFAFFFSLYFPVPFLCGQAFFALDEFQ